jgi:hypothetical protein
LKSHVGTGFGPCIEVYSLETVDFMSVIRLFLRQCVDRSPDLSFRYTGHGLKPARTCLLWLTGDSALRGSFATETR